MSLVKSASTPVEIYAWLMAGPSDGAGFHRHVLASALSLAAQTPGASLSQAMGLSWAELTRLITAEFPHADVLLNEASPETDGGAAITIEEPDLRVMLTANASPFENGLTAERVTWMAHIIARRAQCSNHLWQDLGLPQRKDLTRLMTEYFQPLAQRNDRDMKWKKFFYRQMCEDEGMSLCKSPVCDTCTDFTECFNGEEGHAVLAQNDSLARNTKV